MHILKFFTDKNIESGSDIVIEGFVKSQSQGKYHTGFETIINRIKIQEES